MSVNKLATALAVIFVVSLIALIAQLLYVLWRRRAFCRRAHSPGADPRTCPAGETSSKELLYFLCLKSQSRIQPAGPAPEPPASGEEDQVIDVFKLLRANGPSRVLCTIKEEEREGIVESPAEKHKRGCALFSDKVTMTSSDDFDVDGDTPFETPCATPQYFTPAASPERVSGGLGVMRKE